MNKCQQQSNELRPPAFLEAQELQKRKRPPEEMVSLEEDLLKKTEGKILFKIPTMNDFYISQEGEVFTVKVHKLKIGNDCHGYKHVYTRENHKSHNTIHRLLARTFLNFVEGKNDVRHLDGNKQNNSLENLAWGTRFENCADKIVHVIKYNRKWNSFQKLKAHQVLEIRKLSSEGMSQKKLAKKFGVKSHHVSGIVRRQKWKWL